MALNPTGDDNLAGNAFTDSDGDEHLNGTTVYVEAAQVYYTATTTIKAIELSAAINVTVPAITDPDIASVDVDVSTAFTAVLAVGDFVAAIPQEAMETNARIQSAYVIGADSIRVVFGSLGGNVTGGAKSFKFLAIDLT